MDTFRFEAPPPLSLYVHVPWCERKCPYCDFNSHPLGGELPEDAYIDALLRDLDADLPRVWGRRVRTIFIGGGTPSLLSAAAVDRLLAGIRARLTVAPDAEITLEANPGSAEQQRFAGFRAAGVNRLSIGVQSFDDRKLAALGRIHDGATARNAAAMARAAGFDNFNLDLMFGLPDQTPDQALADLRIAIDLEPTHLSVYQLTLEPNTPFYARPPVLPDEDRIAAMHESLTSELARAGFSHYEVSAYARLEHRCRHNLNYWQFGDYLGIGAGAHGKITDATGIVRLAKRKQPQDYLRHAGSAAGLAEEQRLTPRDAAFEFMLNALRLVEGVPVHLFTERTGLALEPIEAALVAARARGLLDTDPARLRASALGRRFLNDLIELFLPASVASQRG